MTPDHFSFFVTTLRTALALVAVRNTDPLGRVSIPGNELRFQMNMAITNALGELNKEIQKDVEERK